MATAPSATPDATTKTAKVVGYGDYIEGQIRKTRQQVKWVELCGGAITLVVGVLAWLFLAILIDHWVIPLGTLGRWLFLLTLLGGSGTFFVMRMLPLFTHRVNSVYAAHAIEQHTPSLKNALVNLLLLRGNRGGVSRRVLRAVEEQAAQRMANVPVENAVDRSRLIKLGYAMLAVMVVCALYGFLSSKDPFATVRRIVAPWADINAPTRVAIAKVRPGNTAMFAEEFAKIEALVEGIRGKEPVELHYSTADGSVRTLRMKRPKGSSKSSARWEAEFPEGSDGLQQGIKYKYFVTAGDARSDVFTVDVLIPPMIAVTRVDYVYPAYTRLAPRVAEKQGNIFAIEGTRVTVHAEANQEIKISESGRSTAMIDFDCDGVGDREMSVSGTKATASFTLRLQDEHTSYQVLFSNTVGHSNPSPIRHKIEVQADEAPRIVIIEPKERTIEVPENRSLNIVVEASDPDFGLRIVALQFEDTNKSGDLLIDHKLLDEDFRDDFSGQYQFVPSQHKLKAGDVVQFWARARDNREPPRPKKKRFVRFPERADFTIRIVKPVENDQQPNENDNGKGEPKKQEMRTGEPQPQEGAKPDENKGDNGGGGGQGGPMDKKDDKPKGGEGGEGTDGPQGGGESADGKKGKGEAGSGDGNDGQESGETPEDLTDGELMERIRKQREQQKGNKPPQGGGESDPNAPKNQDPPTGGEGGSDGGTEGGSDGATQPKEGGNGNKPPEGGGEKGEGPAKGEDPPPGGSGTKKPGANDGGAGKDEQNPKDSDNPPAQGKPPKKGEDDDTKPMGTGNGDEPTDTQSSGGPREGDGGTAEGAKGDNKEPKGKQDPDQKGSGMDPQGNSGSGGKSDDNDKGSPMGQAGKKPRDKKDVDNSDPDKDESPPSPSVSETESKNSKPGGAKGDRSGAGAEGGGQKANREGSGGAGRNTASDEGGSSTDGEGMGETGKKKGDDVEADGETGSSGENKGKGSRKREGDGADGGTQSGSAPDGTNSDRVHDGGKQDNDTNSGRGEVRNGGRPGGERPRKEEGNFEADKANLDHAKKQTGLNLEYLKDMLAKNKSADELAKKLNMTPEELRAFHDKWSKVRQRADNKGADAKEARDQLKNLGLRRGGSTATGARKGDDQTNLRGSFRSKPPSEYADQIRAFYEGRKAP